MEINKIEVFECSQCARLSRKEADIEKCLKKHDEVRIKDEQKATDLAKIESVKFHLVNNLRSKKPEDVARLLIEAAAMLGFDLEFSICTSNMYYGETYRYDVRGTFRLTRLPLSIRDTFNVALNYELEIMARNTTPSFNDFIRFMAGVEVSGGCIGTSFSGSFTIHRKQIPYIDGLSSEHEALEANRRKFMSRQAELKKAYVATRVPVLRITDLQYLNTEDMYKELIANIDEMNASAKLLLTSLQSREKELRDADDEILAITPEPEYNYDVQRFEELNSLLWIRK